MVSGEDKYFLEEIQNNNPNALKKVFETFYRSLCNYAFQFLNDYDMAEEVVQGLFVKLWEKRSGLAIESSLKSYLFRSVRNQCFNLIQHEKVKKLHEERIRESLISENAEDDYYISPELKVRIGSVIDSMPEKRREIFRLSREEGLKYREIAERLNISVKTVETQMGLALKTLREKIRYSLLLLYVFLKRI